MPNAKSVGFQIASSCRQKREPSVILFETASDQETAKQLNVLIKRPY